MVKLNRSKLTVDEIMNLNFIDFSESGHFYMINKRIKDNPGLPNRFNKMLTGQMTSIEDLNHAIDMVNCYSKEFDESLRLYIHVNGFDMRKTIQHFIYSNLDILFKNQDFKKYIYSNLSSSMCLKKNNFNNYKHWDIDEVGDIEEIYNNIKNIFNNCQHKHVRPFEELLVDYYPTKTGIHMIMKGYDPVIHNDVLKIYPNIAFDNNAFACVYYN